MFGRIDLITSSLNFGSDDYLKVSPISVMSEKPAPYCNADDISLESTEKNIKVVK